MKNSLYLHFLIIVVVLSLLTWTQCEADKMRRQQFRDDCVKSGGRVVPTSDGHLTCIPASYVPNQRWGR